MINVENENRWWWTHEKGYGADWSYSPRDKDHGLVKYSIDTSR